MMELRRLPQRFIDGDVVDAGYAEARSYPVPHQSSDHGLSAGHLADLGRGIWGNGHAWRKA
jgi:hypothetical protein